MDRPYGTFVRLQFLGEIKLKSETAYRKGIGSWRANFVSVYSQILIAAALYLICYHLFYGQASRSAGALGTYLSDLTAHIIFSTKGTGYSLLFRIIGFLVNHFGPAGVAVLESSMVVLTWYFGKRLIDRIVGYSSVVSLYASLGLIFLACIHVPGRTYLIYEVFVVTQPWHNITFIGMRLLAVLTIYFFIDLYKNYHTKIIWKNYVLTSSFLFLSACVKPNFFISFSLALFIVIVIDFLRTPERRKRVWEYLILGSMVFPTCIILYVQSLVLYPSGIGGGGNPGTSGITLIWFRDLWGCSISQLLTNVFLSLAFPITVFLFNKGGDKISRYICLLYLVSFVIANLFEETGPRWNDGNFFWGMFCAGYFLFLFAISLFLKNWNVCDTNKKTTVVYKFVCVILFACHVVSGFCYFLLLSLGASFHV